MASIKILLIEDEPTVFRLYQKLLTLEGYDVVIAQTGNDGVAELKKGGYALVLLDILLPQIDGLGILKTAKENDLFDKNGPIIVLSNLDVESAIKTAMELGAKDYLVKSDIEPSARTVEVIRLAVDVCSLVNSDPIKNNPPE
jgi:DNA-binding response OmpR family regulator